MSDPMSGPVPRCPWCSAVLAATGAEQCPSCGAQLVSSAPIDGEIKGVTTLDTEAILRARSAVARPRNRFLALITGDEEEAASAREHQESLAQPSDEVRREMLRLEMAARLAAVEAERKALQADAMAQLGITVDDLAAAEAARLAGHEATAVESAPPALDADAPAGDWPAELHPAEDASVQQNTSDPEDLASPLDSPSTRID